MYIGTLTIMILLYMYTCRYTDYNDLVVHVYRYTDYNDLVQVLPTFSLHLTSAMFLLFSYHFVYLDPFLHVYIHNYSTKVIIDLHVPDMGTSTLVLVLKYNKYSPSQYLQSI